MPGRPTFRAAVSMVSVSAVVRKHNGQWVPGLTQNEFEVLDNGAPRRSTAFEATNRGVNMALLVDFSGSMDIAAKLTPVHQTAPRSLELADAGRGHDRALRVRHDGARAAADGARLRYSAREARHPAPFGATSIYDAIAETSQVLTSQGPRRAIVAITDGGDNAQPAHAERGVRDCVARLTSRLHRRRRLAARSVGHRA